MSAKVLMVQGTHSGVGKTFLVAALCRLLSNRGLRVAPFKVQNMSNNSFATEDGREIARAQAMQAECARTLPCAQMNPILLKPESDSRSQVILNGRPLRRMSVQDYFRFQKKGWEAAKEAFQTLADRYEVIVAEGAGSPAEINLMDRDIANMRFARWAKAAVILVGDIDQGGVFASLYGTLRILPPRDRQRIIGLVLNKFRGEPSLLKSGIEWLEKKTGIPVLGVIPYQEGLMLDWEDGFDLERMSANPHPSQEGIEIGVIRFPRISNFTDVRPLLMNRNKVRVRFIDDPRRFGNPDLVILPGTKNTLGDLRFLRMRGFESLLERHVKRGKILLGICGGFQMMGEEIEDREGWDGEPRCEKGLGLFRGKTWFHPQKIVRQVEAVPTEKAKRLGIRGDLRGYEIHMGRTKSCDPRASAFLKIVKRDGRSSDEFDGLIMKNGLIFGTYLHGLWDSDEFRRSFLSFVYRKREGHKRIAEDVSSISSLDFELEKERDYESLANLVESHLTLEPLFQQIGLTR